MLKGFLLKTSVCPERLCYPFSSISEKNKKKTDRTHPFPHVFASTIYKQPLNDFMILFGMELHQCGSATNRATGLVYQ